jgi:hypothetical protein
LTTAFQSNAFENDAFQIDAGGAVGYSMTGDYGVYNISGQLALFNYFDNAKRGVGNKKKQYQYSKLTKETNWLFRDIRDFYVELIDKSMPEDVIAETIALVINYSFTNELIPSVNSIKWSIFEQDKDKVSQLLDLWINNIPDPALEDTRQKISDDIKELENEISIIKVESDVAENLSPQIASLNLKIAEHKAYIETLNIINKAKKTPGQMYQEYKNKKRILDIAYIAAYLSQMED